MGRPFSRGWQALYGLILIAVLAWPSYARAQLFEDAVQDDSSSRGAGDAPLSHIQVSSAVAVNSIAVLNSITAAHNLKFIIYNRTSASFEYLGAAEAFPADATGVFSWKQSTSFSSVTLLPGQMYLVGAISDAAGEWSYSTVGAFTQNGVTSSQTNGNVNGFATPVVVEGLSGARIPLRLYVDVPTADLAITKTDGVTSVAAGGSVTYTITASNAGPSNATGATVADTFPAVLTGTWTCVGAGGGACTAAGSGNISDTVNLPAGGSVTYTVSATVSPSASGTLSNTATVTVPAGMADPAPGNNSATDTDAIISEGDLSVSLTGPAAIVPAGSWVTYTLTAANAGPSDAPGTAVNSTLASLLSNISWTCLGSGGGVCAASGSGNVSDSVNLPAGGSVVYTITALVSANVSGNLDSTASITAPASYTDVSTSNDSASFGIVVAAAEPPVAVPALSAWLLAVLGGLLFAVSAGLLSRRSRRQSGLGSTY